MTSDPGEVVRRGYDAVSYQYRGDDDMPEQYLAWLDELQDSLPERADVLDLGCGCGVPVARVLDERGHRVTGVDISGVQVERARRLVPGATFMQADATTVSFPDGSFDAVVCLYALIHMPLDAQPALIERIGRWLRPGGVLLATTGAREWTGGEDGWLGGDASMWWSQADAATYRAWITRAGLDIIHDEFVPEGDSGHQFFRASRGNFVM
ncbi:class I SAM-dependent methyltransferase [Dactylosporangium darangshiense]|uniref:Class I SAM-dependent methyltransferase n=1 Tax=Dactylosporangium darangshiense TaxID=579108 RepID=A0ABP8CYV8_9ACTN